MLSHCSVEDNLLLNTIIMYFISLTSTSTSTSNFSLPMLKPLFAIIQQYVLNICIVYCFRVYSGRYIYSLYMFIFLLSYPDPMNLSTIVYPNRYITLCKFNQTSRKITYIHIQPIQSVRQNVRCTVAVNIL